MKRYRSNPIFVEAVQWWAHGDHPAVTQKPGQTVTYNRCLLCGHPGCKHGWLEAVDGGRIICPGDYIIVNAQGEYRSCKPKIFESLYEEVI